MRLSDPRRRCVSAVLWFAKHIDEDYCFAQAATEVVPELISTLKELRSNGSLSLFA